jgi:hypothetical protein
MRALVDYYNVAGFQAGRRLTYRDHEEALDYLASTLVERVVPELARPSPSELLIRLYGGWFVADRSTDDRDMLAIAVQRHFPRRRPLRVRVQFADGVAAVPGEPLFSTLRPWSGWSPFVIVPEPNGCAHSWSSCPIRQLEEWRRRGCPLPDCDVRTEAVVGTPRQKLVDTALVADLISMAIDDSGEWTVAVSNDDDVVPGAMAAVRLGSLVALTRIGRRKASAYDPALARIGLPVLDI